jgi:uncharacterized surface protein with fasciclin (FAS1) repeats
MAGIPPFNPQIPIPNNPFNNPDADRYNLSYPTGQLILGQNLKVDYTTGTVSISPDPPNNGTVYQVTAGPGLATTPPGGIVATGTIGLQVIPTLTAGSYTYTSLSVNPYGKVTLAVSGTNVLVNLIGSAPIIVSGNNPSRSLGIIQGTTLVPGAVQTVDNTSSNDSTKALSAQQGYLLQMQISNIASSLGGQAFGGFVDTTTGNITQLTPEGQARGGLSVGAVLPTPPFVPAGKYEGLYFILSASGTYVVPGGVPTVVVKDDRVFCIDDGWQVLLCGTRLAAASSGAAGLTVLATAPEVQALTEPNKSVTPGALAAMVASETQVGFVELATDAETQAFTDTTRAVTSSNIGTLQATTSARGIVQLSDSTADSSVTFAPTSNALKKYNDSTLKKISVVAKGDLIVGLDYEQPIILTQGPNTSQLVVDDTKLALGGLDWTVPDSLFTWPVGAVIWHLATVTPSLWLPCDGRLLDGAISGPYYDLFDLIGTTYNTGGEPAGFFRLPDLRGMFVRGWSGADGGATPPPTALDPGRAYASVQTDAYKQHCHTVTDPGHFHAFSLPQHAHGVTDPQHRHPVNDPLHAHFILGIPNAEVVGNEGGFYDGNGGLGNRTPNSDTRTTGIGVLSRVTAISLQSQVTGITQANLCITGLTVDNAPPTAPNPNDSRPYNIALLPMIKYANN